MAKNRKYHVQASTDASELIFLVEKWGETREDKRQTLPDQQNVGRLLHEAFTG